VAGAQTAAERAALRALAKPANVTLTATVAGISLSATESVLSGHRLALSGSAPRSDAGDTIEIERQSQASRWVPVAQPTVTATGVFAASWRASASGRFSVRALLAGPAATGLSPQGATAAAPILGPSSQGATAASAPASGLSPLGATAASAPASGLSPPRATAASAPASGPSPPGGAAAGAPQAPTLTITVYRLQTASWYGPGFFGHRTACGERLLPDTLGVANIALKCGTRVDLEYRGRRIVVPVIDRGPYSAGVQWDLTEATAVALGMAETGAIGALATPAR
jgi:hypothetical protein